MRVLAAQLPAGAALPSTRTLQRRFAISALTAQRVLSALSREGLIAVEPGRGSFVAAPARVADLADLSWQTAALGSRGETGSADAVTLLAPLPEGVLDLRLGYLDLSLQPSRLLTAAASRAARRPGIWDRAPTEGLTELRALLAADAGAHHTADDVLITSGGQAALSLVFRALATPGDQVLFEHLTYPGAVAAARAAGLQPTPVRADHDGVIPDALAAALRRTGARLVYLQPRYSNPTGSLLPAERRHDVLRLLAEHDAFCIEDDYVASLDLSGPSPAPLSALDSAGHIVRIQSLSKPVAPGLRIAAITSAGAATARLRRARIVDDLFVAPLLQQTALELLTAPGWTRHLTATRRELTARRNTLSEQLHANSEHAHTIRTPRGGLNLWWPLPADINEADLVTRTAERGVAITAGSGYVLGDPTGPAVRLSYGRATLQQLTAAAKTLADTVAHAAVG